MTLPANSLTSGASVRAPQSAPSESYPAAHLKVFVDALERLGHDVTPALDELALDRSGLTDPDALVPCSAIGTLIAHVSRERPVKNLPFLLAAEVPIGAYALLDYLVLTSETVADGHHQLARYFQLQRIPIDFEICEEEFPARVRMSSPGNPFGIEYSVCLDVLHFRRETEGRIDFAGVSLMHEPDDAAALERALGCPVHTRASWNGVAIPKASWRLPLKRRDPILRGLLERQASEALARISGDGGVADAARRVLAARIAGGDTGVDTVAKRLGMSARTLQRRLRAESTSYQRVLDGVRRNAAEGYLSDSTLSVAEVGYLLGFSEPAAFHRAFRRWRGTTPLEFRRARP
jgi:AraC-like DNA-binding protein